MPETELVDQYHQQVFGHDEFMSVFLAAVNGLFQYSGCTFGLFDLCHFLLLLLMFHIEFAHARNSPSKLGSSLA